MESLEAKSVAL